MREHRHRLRVRYAETDAQGVAHHAAYVPWLEEARIEALRAVGQSYRELEAGGIYMPVVELAVKYRAAAKFDDELDLISVWQAEGRFKLRFATRIERAGTLLAEAEVAIACIGVDGRLRPVPAVVLPAAG